MKRRACLLLTWTVSSLFLECWETLLTLSWNNSFLWPAFGVCRVHRIKHLFYEQILTFEFDWLKLKLTLELFDWSLIDLSTGDSCVKFKRNLLELFAMDFPNDGSESSVSFTFVNFGLTVFPPTWKQKEILYFLWIFHQTFLQSLGI